MLPEPAHLLWSANHQPSDNMPPSTETEHPLLTPAFCFSTKDLKDFLRVSRSTVDDTINQNLNALFAPSLKKFDLASTSQHALHPTYRGTLPRAACEKFTDTILMPSWQSRSDVLNYCASVATSDDPDDPDLLTRIASNSAERERIVDERLDPYSGRFFPKESRTETLASVVRNERMVEEIVRERSWKIVRERCDQFGARDWREALNAWRERTSGSPGCQ